MMIPTKRMKMRHVCIAIALAIVAIIAYLIYSIPSFVEVESEHTELIDGIESYQSIDDFASYLEEHSYEWEGKAGGDAPRGRPPFIFYTITISNYSHMGITGRLVAKFYNNRLMYTAFYIPDIDKYLEILSNKTGLALTCGQPSTLPPYTRITCEKSYAGNGNVTWSDIRLEKEVLLWIDIYA